MNERETRRTFFTVAGAGALLVACRRGGHAEPDPASASAAPPTTHASEPATGGDEDQEPEVTATEDLMREHGVIRRVLVVYREAAMRLRSKGASVPPEALQNAARLIRTFGEDYHEKQLEEANIFPALTKSGGALAGTVATLIAQHQRGREITEYILAVTQKAIGAQTAEPLAATLEAFARMYEEHAAVEDTIVFPAWKKRLSPKELDAAGDRFEDIEHKTFGKDGFDDAVDRIAAIERMMHIDPAGLTAPPPPKP